MVQQHLPFKIIKMGQSESKENKLRSLLKVRSYGECFEEDGVTYVPTRSIVVTMRDPDIPFTQNYLQSILTRYMDTQKSLSHIDQTDNKAQPNGWSLSNQKKRWNSAQKN